jgi:hypothetical protein
MASSTSSLLTGVAVVFLSTFAVFAFVSNDICYYDSAQSIVFYHSVCFLSISVSARVLAHATSGLIWRYWRAPNEIRDSFGIMDARQI